MKYSDYILTPQGHKLRENDPMCEILEEDYTVMLEDVSLGYDESISRRASVFLKKLVRAGLVEAKEKKGKD